MPNPFRLTIKWHLDYTLFPNCLTWQRGQTPVERDGFLYDETITPAEGVLTSEKLATRLEKIIDENAMVNTSGKVVQPMAAYTAEQLRALARQIRKAESKVEVFAYDELVNPKTPWEHATSVNGTETPYNERSGWIFRGVWKTNDGNSNPLWLWLTPIPVVEV